MKRSLVSVLEAAHRAGMARTHRRLGSCLLGLLLLSSLFARGGTTAEAWVRRYHGPGNGTGFNDNDFAAAVAVGTNGNVYVTGASYADGGYRDYATIAYSGEGVALWTNRYDGAGHRHDYAAAVAVGKSGNVFVTGSSMGFGGTSYGYATIAYSAAGEALWTNRFDESGNDDESDGGAAVAVDSSGNVFVTGRSATSSGVFADWVTIAYSGAGVALWTNRYNGPGDSSDTAKAVAVDHRGNVFVTGYSFTAFGDSEYVTIAYSPAGARLWINRYNGPGFNYDYAAALAVDSSGNVFVTGSSPGLDGYWDYATVAYSGAGVALWTNRYNGPASTNDVAVAIAADNSGNVFVTGYSTGSGGPADIDYVTIAYSGAGVALWTNRYNGPANSADYAQAVAVDSSGTVFVAGHSEADYATIAYSGSGVPLWTNRYNGAVNGFDSVSGLALAPAGAVYVTGSSDSNVGSGRKVDYATVKYVWRAELAIQPLPAGSSTVNLKLSGPPNSSWSIERALMLGGPWTNLGPSLLGANGLGAFQDVNPPAGGAFYRAVQP